MSLESVFKLSLIMNMIDNLSGPMAGVASKVGANVSKLDAASQTFGSMAKAGAAMQETGSQIVNAVLAPVEATFETRRALGELASLGVQDLEAVENAARSFSDQWAGTSKADFISAAYDIKSGIASLSDEGVAEFTSLAALTAKATKSTAGEMTSLFATGYGIYKDYYSDLSDMEFGEMFSAGISDAVRAFKTSGSGMAQAIQNLGASATTAQVPLEEQLSVLGMLQATMGGAEAGTKYKAFLRSATKGGEALGLKFTDANNQLLSMPEILDILRGKFGETMDAAEKMELQKAFGDTEAVALIDLMYNKVGDLQDNIVNMYGSLGKGVSVTEQMASAIQETEPERFERLKQRIHNVTESIGNSLLPTVNDLMSKGEGVLTKVGSWIEKNQELVKVIMLIVLAVGGFLAVGGTLIALISGVGLVVTKTVSAFKQLFGGIGKNFANPALVGRIVLFLSFSKTMTAWVFPDAVSSATPLAQLAAGQKPELWTLLLGNHGGCIGETCALALLLGGAYLLLRGVITWQTPVCFVGTVFVLSLILGQDAVRQILSGGLLLGAFFMATDYVTAPQTCWGRALFGIGAGLLTCLIRFYGSYAEGVSFAILFMNILTPYLSKWTRSKPLGGVPA